jgi:hypothetical protein
MVPCSDGTKDENHGESCDSFSPERELESQLDGTNESTRFTPLNNIFILHNTCNNNTQQEVPSTLGVREIASDEASKKTSLTRL